MTINDVPGTVVLAFQDTTTMHNIHKGLNVTGIFLFHKDVFVDGEFLFADVYWSSKTLPKST